MSEKRFKLSKYVTPSSVSYFCDENGRMLNKEVVKMLNEQQDQISYWKHKVSSLLWILGQFDEQKVKKLLEELEDE